MWWGRLAVAGTGVASVAAGVATNRVSGPWWAQLLWGAGGAVSFMAAVWLGRMGRPADEGTGGARTPGDTARQEVTAGRDGFTAGRDMTVTIQAPAVEPAGGPSGRGALWPPLGRLPGRVRGRDVLLERLVALAEAPDGRAHVLAGLGGTGKSTVALQLARVAADRGARVWWVPAVDASSLTAALLGLAEVLGADAGLVEAGRAGRVNPADVLWPVLEDSPGWVLVLDNADDLAELAVGDRPAGDGNGWVRGSDAGLVVVTSRTGDPRRWGGHCAVHPVGWLSAADGGSVLLDLAPGAGGRAEAEDLAGRLGGLALALHHAGSQLGSPFAAIASFTGYRRALEERFPAVLEAADGRADRAMVTRTWELSLTQLERAGVSQARGLLGTLAWFAGAVPIPSGGLDHRVLGRACGDLGADGVGPGLAALLSVGLIQTGLAPQEDAPGRGGVLVHPLVAQITRHRLTAAGETPAAAGTAVAALQAATGALQASDPEDWPLWAAWLPHLEELLRTAGSQVGEVAVVALAQVAADATLALVWAGSYPAALSMAETGLRHTGRLGSDHPDVLHLRHMHAGAHYRLGDVAEAERLFRAILRDDERVLGPDHPHTLATRHEVARAVAERGDAAEAERLYREVLSAMERVHGPGHSHTLATRYEVARMVAEQGDAAGAERMFREVLAAEEEVLGPDHPDTLTTRHEVAWMVAKQGDAAGAGRLFREILRIRERVLGPDHPDTLNSRHGVAQMVAAQGDAAGAGRLFREVLRDKERVLGPDHPSTLLTAEALRNL
ncbi:hypothetical protein DPM19_22340 [Actinomadura craniellae]|uniref:Tetratricopeptide repeat protein n=1 Tax=Actinomadura craniellae TaxID=2231787 RepID=A0A365H294_9ACTN|nr:hypothetical protein DPM19_22340 [Actinomadura craniellae]